MSFIGKYEVIRELASGGMAKVFLARAAGPQGFEKRVVVKKILAHLTEDKEFVEMFLSEARTAAAFNHPNVVQVFELGEADGSYFIAMEFIDGPNLRALHRRAHELKVQLRPAVIAQIIAYACEGLGYAHDFRHPQTGEPMQLVHRDVSPDNILLSRTGTVKVVDFGIAKGANDGNPHHTRTGSVKGKLAYMAPEQISGGELDKRADVYALGILLYELLTGSKPYRNTTSDVKLMHSILYEQIVPLAERRPDLPETLIQIVDRALAKDRTKRYQTCAELQGDLHAFVALSGEVVTPSVLAKLVSDLGLGTDPNLTLPPAASSGASRPPLPPGASRPPMPPSLSRPPMPPSGARPSSFPGPALTGSKIPTADDDLVILLDEDAGGAKAKRKLDWRWPALAGLAVALGSIGTAVLLRGGGSAQAAVPTPAPVAQVAAAAKPEPKPAAVEAPPAAATPTDVVPAVATADANGDEAQVVPASAREGSLATFAISSNVRATVKVNGRVVGTTPARNLRVPAGRVRVELFDRDAGFHKEETFRLSPGDNGTKTIAVAEGKLEFRVRPYASVILDGRAVGQTPLTVSAVEGKHNITLVNRDLGKEVKLTYEVKANQTNVVKYILEDE